MKGRLSDIKRIEIGDHDRYRNGIFVERVTLSDAFHFHWHGYYEIDRYILTQTIVFVNIDFRILQIFLKEHGKRVKGMLY